jgi:hypothetical protein
MGFFVNVFRQFLAFVRREGTKNHPLCGCEQERVTPIEKTAKL